MANELRKHPKWDGNVGCVFLGGFYNVAPWPVGNKELAKKFLGEACNSAPLTLNLKPRTLNLEPQTSNLKP